MVVVPVRLQLAFTPQVCRVVSHLQVVFVRLQTYNLLQVQVHGALKFPLPSVSYSSEHGHQGLGLGEGTYEMRLDQLNPCIRL
jgi:hypothetical protein